MNYFSAVTTALLLTKMSLKLGIYLPASNKWRILMSFRLNCRNIDNGPMVRARAEQCWAGFIAYSCHAVYSIRQGAWQCPGPQCGNHRASGSERTREPEFAGWSFRKYNLGVFRGSCWSVVGQVFMRKPGGKKERSSHSQREEQELETTAWVQHCKNSPSSQQPEERNLSVPRLIGAQVDIISVVGESKPFGKGILGPHLG